MALGAADPLAGAALMFAFTLGTSPLFFAVTYFTTQLSARLEKYSLRFVAVVVLILGLVTIDSGLNLAGSPVSFSRAARLFFPQNVAGAQANETASFATAPGPQAPANAEADNVITVTVKNNGYQPDVVHARAGAPLRLKLVAQGVYSCSQAFVIPALDVQMNLKSTGVAWVDIPPQAKDTVMPFSCSMGMFTGDIIFDL